MSQKPPIEKKPPVEIEKILASLEKHNGDRAKVREELQINADQLNGLIKRHPQLRKFHKHKQTEIANVLEKLIKNPQDPNNILPSPDDLKLARLVEIEDRKLKDSFIRFGGSEMDADLALSFTEFRNRHVESILGMTVTGMSNNFIQMQKVLRELEKRIEQGDFDLNEQGEPCEEQMVYEAYRAFQEESRKIAEMVWRGQIAKAKVEAMIRLGRNAIRREPTTPGFAPKAAKVTTQ